MHLYTKDNSTKQIATDSQEYSDLKKIADIKLDKLKDEFSKDLWLFPPKGDRYEDKINSEVILSLDEGEMTTYNIMGFISSGSTELTIRSRFSHDEDSEKEGQDWFMQYMLQKVFQINIFNLSHSQSTDDALDIAAFLLPYFLQKALRQGLYREYVRREYNDSRVRGTIDFSRHIKENFPFQNGKMAYSTREYTYDNSITQLVRHTIEYIKTRKAFASSVLYASKDSQANIKQIIEATPSYRKGDLNKVIKANLKPKIHPYYSEYRPLQRLCLQILRNEKISYGNGLEKIHGILFDGAWLWEEYLNTIFSKAGYIHPENRKKTNAIPTFIDTNRHPLFPDFKKENVIADAKYKFLYRKNTDYITENMDSKDLSQMITYLHVTSSSKGFFICPMANISQMDVKTGEFLDNVAFTTRVGQLQGMGGEIGLICVNIPQDCNNYKEFVAIMKRTEELLEAKFREY